MAFFFLLRFVFALQPFSLLLKNGFTNSLLYVLSHTGLLLRKVMDLVSSTLTMYRSWQDWISGTCRISLAQVLQGFCAFDSMTFLVSTLAFLPLVPFALPAVVCPASHLHTKEVTPRSE